jgi:hypothetical protein
MFLCSFIQEIEACVLRIFGLPLSEQQLSCREYVFVKLDSFGLYEEAFKSTLE